jgi:hypothetical protein
MAVEAPDPVALKPQRLAPRVKTVIAAVVVGTLIVVVMEPGCLCGVPFVGLFLATIVSTLRAKGTLRICGVAFSVLTGIVAMAALVNLWNVAAASRPIRAAGGAVHTGGDDINQVLGLTAITWVDFAGPAFADSDLERLAPSLRRFPKLAVITLTNTNVTDAGLKNFYGIESLKVLHLWNTPVTPEGLAELQRALPTLQIDSGPAT